MNKTRFDKFKEQSIEELADFIRLNGSCGMCAIDMNECKVTEVVDCRENIIAWLKQEIPEPAKPLTINEYQELAMRTDNKDMLWHNALLDGVLGLNGEAGECADIVKKHLFQGHKLDREHLIEELGDVAWYLAKCAKVLNVDLEDILRANIAKLEKRYPEGFDVKRSVNREK